MDSDVTLLLVTLSSNNKKRKCFCESSETIRLYEKVLDKIQRCLRVYLWFFRMYACKLQNNVLDMVLQMVENKYDKLLPELESHYDEDKLYIKKYHCWWEPNITLSLRIQQFYNIWIRLFAMFQVDIHWGKIDFRVVMCKTNRLFSFLVQEKLIDKLIILNLDKLHRAKFGKYLCEDVFNAFDRMGLNISKKIALGNFGAMCQHRRFLMNSNLDEIVVNKKYYRNTDLIKQYVHNRDYEAYERIISMIDFSHKDLRDLFIDFIEKEGDLRMIEHITSTIQRFTRFYEI